MLLLDDPPNANVSPGPVADDGADVKEKDPAVDGCSGSLFTTGFSPKVNGADGAVVCPKPAKGLLSKGLVSLANGLGVEDVPKTKGEAAFDWPPKAGAGAPAPNENAPLPRAGLDSPALSFGVDCCTSRVGLSSMRTSWSSCLGGVMGLSVGPIVTGTPNEEKGLAVIPLTLPPSPLKENVTGAGAILEDGPEG